MYIEMTRPVSGQFMNPVRHYAGIGSRETPPPIRNLMMRLAGDLAVQGWHLRSGAAAGADTSFEEGVIGASQYRPYPMEIFLPWAGFEGRKGAEYIVVRSTPELDRTVEVYHPTPERLSRVAFSLIRRNACQVLGADLKSPADIVICWAPGSRLKRGKLYDVDGGTGQAVRIAYERGIPVFNLALNGASEQLSRHLNIRIELPRI